MCARLLRSAVLTHGFPVQGNYTHAMETGTTTGEEEEAIREGIKATETTEEGEEAGITTTTAASLLEGAMTMRARRTEATRGEGSAPPPLQATTLTEEATGAVAGSSPGAEAAGATTAEEV